MKQTDDGGAESLEIKESSDIVEARKLVKRFAEEAGLGNVDQTKLATAISELTRNIVNFAGEGKITVRGVVQEGRKGVEVVCEDRGPGIEDVEKAMEDGYSTGDGMGLGLSGSERLVDSFEIDSEVGRGTKVTVRMWGSR